MLKLSINDLKKSERFKREIRWDVTPRIFLNPESAEESGGEKADVTYGYMLYVDEVMNRPTVVIMQMKYMVSRTVGFIDDVPEELLRDAIKKDHPEAVAGMYPLSDELKEWLKEQLAPSQ